MISIPNTNLHFEDDPRIVLRNGLKFNPDGSITKGQNCQINQGDIKLVEYSQLPGSPVEYWVLTAYGWAIHDQVRV